MALEVTPKLLHQVQLENMAMHQFADGVEDGVDWETAKEQMNMHSPAEVEEMIRRNHIHEPETSRPRSFAGRARRVGRRAVRPHPGPIPGESEGEVRPEGYYEAGPISDDEKTMVQQAIAGTREAHQEGIARKSFLKTQQ